MRFTSLLLLTSSYAADNGILEIPMEKFFDTESGNLEALGVILPHINHGSGFTFSGGPALFNGDKPQSEWKNNICQEIGINTTREINHTLNIKEAPKDSLCIYKFDGLFNAYKEIDDYENDENIKFYEQTHKVISDDKGSHLSDVIESVREVKKEDKKLKFSINSRFYILVKNGSRNITFNVETKPFDNKKVNEYDCEMDDKKYKITYSQRYKPCIIHVLKNGKASAETVNGEELTNEEVNNSIMINGADIMDSNFGVLPEQMKKFFLQCADLGKQTEKEYPCMNEKIGEFMQKNVDSGNPFQLPAGMKKGTHSIMISTIQEKMITSGNECRGELQNNKQDEQPQKKFEDCLNRKTLELNNKQQIKNRNLNEVQNSSGILQIYNMYDSFINIPEEGLPPNAYMVAFSGASENEIVYINAEKEAEKFKVQSGEASGSKSDETSSKSDENLVEQSNTYISMKLHNIFIIFF